jgi:hypothetical protein
MPALRELGIEVTIPPKRSNRGRIILIEKRAEPQSQPSQDTAGAAESWIVSDGRADSVTVGDDPVTVEPPPDLLRNTTGNGPSDGSDGWLRSTSTVGLPDAPGPAGAPPLPKGSLFTADRDNEIDRLERESLQQEGM